MTDSQKPDALPTDSEPMETGSAASDQPATDDPSAEQQAAAVVRREVKFEHSKDFVPILQHLKSSLLVSTYAAGKTAMVGTSEEGLDLQFCNFQQAMGMAVSQNYLAIGGQNIIWMLQNGGKLVERLEPKDHYEVCFLSRESFITGNIQCHEMAWGKNDELWICNTLFSCLCTLHEDFNFVPRWKPPFISGYAAEDRCHLNGLAMLDGAPKYVSAMGEVDVARGWRENKADGGIIIDVPSGEIVARGLCMPHSPRLYQGKLYVLDSGKGRLVTVDPANGKLETVVEIPAYIRGMSFCGQFAFIGMSRARERSVFGGVPICDDDKRDELRCGVVVVDLVSGQAVAFLQFQTGIEEIFDVQVLPGAKSAFIAGPFPAEDESTPVWVVPDPSKIDELVGLTKLGMVGRPK